MPKIELTDEPFCENCGHLPIGSIIITDENTWWCIDCAEEFFTTITAKIAEKLRKKQQNYIHKHTLLLRKQQEDFKKCGLSA